MTVDFLLGLLDGLAEGWLVHRSTTRADRRYARTRSGRNPKK